MRTDFAVLTAYRTAPGFPFKGNDHIAYQFLAMAIERDDADLLDELLAQHQPNQHPSYKLSRLLPVVLRLPLESTNRARMAVTLLQRAIVDEWDWLNLTTRPIIALLNEVVRPVLGDPETADRSALDIPALSLFVLDILFENTLTARSFLDAKAQDVDAGKYSGLLRLMSKLAAMALDLRLVESLRLLLTHPFGPNPKRFCGEIVPGFDQHRELRVVIPFWTDMYHSPLRFMWMPNVPAALLDILRDYATRHALDSTLLVDVALLDAIRTGDSAAIITIMSTARAAVRPAPIPLCALWVERMDLRRAWVPVMLAAAGYFDRARDLLDQGIWDVTIPATWSTTFSLALREQQFDLAAYLCVHRPADVLGMEWWDVDARAVPSVAVLQWVEQYGDVIVFPGHLQLSSLVVSAIPWMRSVDRAEGIALLCALLQSEHELDLAADGFVIARIFIAFMRTDFLTLKTHRTAPGFPFKGNDHIAYQFLAMAIERDDADLLDDYKLSRLLPAVLCLPLESPNRGRMSLALLRRATVDEWYWLDLTTRPIIALLHDMVRPMIGDPELADRSALAIPALSLFVLDILFENAFSARSFLDAKAQDPNANQDYGLLHLVGKLASVALDLCLFESLQLLLTHPCGPSPANFCGDGESPLEEQFQTGQVVISFWTKYSHNLRYMWARNVPLTVLAILRDYATQLALELTLLADIQLLDAIQVGNGDAIVDIMTTARAAAARDAVDSFWVGALDLRRSWAPAMLAAAGYFDQAEALLDQGVWDLSNAPTWGPIFALALREEQVDLAAYLCAHRPKDLQHLRMWELSFIPSVAMLRWLEQCGDKEIFPKYFDVTFLLAFAMEQMTQVDRQQGTAMIRALYALPHFDLTAMRFSHLRGMLYNGHADSTLFQTVLSHPSLRRHLAHNSNYFLAIARGNGQERVARILLADPQVQKTERARPLLRNHWTQIRIEQQFCPRRNALQGFYYLRKR
ncbi:hypothetical protein GGF32_000567 [Allomyces javanicus]|nr:hypothetical protein GGF32_000567 [Allomyces javanicus]